MPAGRTGIIVVVALFHWLLIAAAAALLVSGFAIPYLEPGALDRPFWDEIHVSLGLTTALLLLLYAISAAVRGPSPRAETSPRWLAPTAAAVTVLLCLALAVQIASGYLDNAVAGRPMAFWGMAIPPWDAAGLLPALPWPDIHRIGASLSAGLVLVHVGFEAAIWVAPDRRAVAEPEPEPAGAQDVEEEAEAPEAVEARPAEPEPSPREEDVRQLALREKQNRLVTAMANNLARNLRLFGWIDLWIQFILALVIGLLLLFASSGRAFSPSPTGFGDGIYWGWFGFLLMFPALILAFYYVSASKKVERVPIAYLHHEKRIAFWFLWTGILIGGLGILVSFLGVAMSIVLLIVKTISQPPGIAITDPNNIIRALDVFVLVVNFMLLIAHFVGVVTALWLGFAAAKARVGYIAVHAVVSR